jgi:hypothetical protein
MIWECLVITLQQSIMGQGEALGAFYLEIDIKNFIDNTEITIIIKEIIVL